MPGKVSVTVTPQTTIQDLQALNKDGFEQLRATKDKTGAIKLYSTSSNNIKNGFFTNGDRQAKIKLGKEVFRMVIENTIKQKLADEPMSKNHKDEITNELADQMMFHTDVQKFYSDKPTRQPVQQPITSQSIATIANLLNSPLTIEY